MRQNEKPRRRATGLALVRAALVGALVVGVAAMLAVGCGQESGTEANTETATATEPTGGEEATEPAEPATEIAGAYSDALGDVYDNMSNEQRAQLAPGLSQEELSALTSEQLAAMAQAQETEEDEVEVENALEATAVNTALGQLNMEEIREAFEQAESIENFEAKINRVYAGPHLLLVQSRQEQNEAITEAYEDLDDSGTIGDAIDDLVFTFTMQRRDRAARLVGSGANSYYMHDWPAGYAPAVEAPQGNFWRNFIVANLTKATWRYVTAAERRAEMRARMEAYRQGQEWLAQQRAARAYYRRMARNPRYVKSLVRVSPARRRWRAKRPRRVVLPPPPRRMKIRVPRRRVKRGPRVRPRPGRPGRPGAPAVEVQVNAPRHPGKAGVPAPPPGRPGAPNVKVQINAPAPPPPPGKVGPRPGGPNVKVQVNAPGKVHPRHPGKAVPVHPGKRGGKAQPRHPGKAQPRHPGKGRGKGRGKARPR